MAARKKDDPKFVEQDLNEDPITGAHGAHPVGVGIGTAAGGAAAGAAAGALGGPVGAVAGAVIGGVAGGLAGKGIAEAIDPTVEEAYWRDEYKNRDYVSAGEEYDLYAPAYRHGWESRGRYADRSYDEAEADLRDEWDATPHSERLPWTKARHATRDAWHRVERAIPGDYDKDGR
jgi:hypothetical protein